MLANCGAPSVLNCFLVFCSGGQVRRQGLYRASGPKLTGPEFAGLEFAGFESDKTPSPIPGKLRQAPTLRKRVELFLKFFECQLVGFEKLLFFNTFRAGGRPGPDTINFLFQRP